MTTHIETPRLLLRDWQVSDLAPFVEMNADEEVMRYFPAPLTEAQTKTLFEAIHKEFSDYGYGLYATEEKETGDFIGFIGFHHAQFDVDFCPCIEIGWRLRKDSWGKGYATEGAQACLRHGFDTLGFEKVYSFTAIENTPSRNVMEKIGMRFYQYFDHPALGDSSPLKPHVCYVADKTTYR